MSDVTQKMYDVMSITKAVIGIMYYIHKPPHTNQKLLNMVGYDEAWDYDDFRVQVEAKTNLKAYAMGRLNRNTGGFSYCNLAYQVLASDMPDVATKFGEFIERPVTSVTSNWICGDGWKWEHSNGQPLGPHGLHMTEEVGCLFGAKARPFLQGDKGVLLGNGWGGCGSEVLQRYWHGWFFKENIAYAIGYVSQMIAVSPETVRVHFYTEDWTNPNFQGCDFVNLKF